jgi:hypothetical protein
MGGSALAATGSVPRGALLWLLLAVSLGGLCFGCYWQCPLGGSALAAAGSVPSALTDLHAPHSAQVLVPAWHS